MTPYAEVIGDPIAQSKSPAIHKFWLAKLGLKADYRVCQVSAAELGSYLNTRRADPAWRGCNVTMPHKQAIIPLLDQIAPQAQTIGAVNTVAASQDRQLNGLNTDGDGFLEPLGAQLGETHWFRMARVLGTGGAARAIVAALASHGFTIVLGARDVAKARLLLDEIDPGGEHHAAALEQFAAATGFAFDDRKDVFDLVVNASPLGMRGQPPLLFDWSHAPPGAFAYDIVTDPADTVFLQGARAAGHHTIDGLSMLIGQAARAFKVFFGAPAPREHDRELRELLVS